MCQLFVYNNSETVYHWCWGCLMLQFWADTKPIFKSNVVTVYVGYKLKTVWICCRFLLLVLMLNWVPQQVTFGRLLLVKRVHMFAIHLAVYIWWIIGATVTTGLFSHTRKIIWLIRPSTSLWAVAMCLVNVVFDWNSFPHPLQSCLVSLYFVLCGRFSTNTRCKTFVYFAIGPGRCTVACHC